MSASSSPGGSPVRPTSKSQLPASIANASLEELQKLFIDSLKKLKARDKRIADLTASQEALQGQAPQHAPANLLADLQQQLQKACNRAEEAERQVTDAHKQSEGIQKMCDMQTQQLEDAAHEKTIHSEQMAGLKEVLRSLAVEKDAAEKELMASKDQVASLESASQSATAQLKDNEQQLTALQTSSAEIQQQLSQASAALEQANAQHQQDLQDLHNARQEAQQSHAAQIAQLEKELQTAQAASNQAATSVAELQATVKAHADSQEEHAAEQDMDQQHAESLAALEAKLGELQTQLATALEAKSSMQTQLDTSLSAQAQQHAKRTDSLTEEIASLKLELRSRESTPESSLPAADLQQQLDSARADASKQANKLAQAEMRASLVRQQLQEARHQLRQLEAKPQHQAQADDLQESLDRANSELNMLQGRLSPTEGLASSAASENGTATPHPSDVVRLVINIASDESGPEPPSVFYAEQKRVKQQLAALKAEKQQLHKQLSSMEETIEERTAQLAESPQQLSAARSSIHTLEQKLQQLEKAAATSVQTETQLTGEVTALNGTVDELKKQLSQALASVESSQAEAAKQTLQLEKVTAEAASLRIALAEATEQAQASQGQLQQLNTKLEGAQADSEASQKQLIELQEAHEAEQTSENSPMSRLKHQLMTAETDRDSLQQQISSLQEAVIKAQHRPSPPASPTSLQPADVPENDPDVDAQQDKQSSLQEQELQAEKAALEEQLDEAQHALKDAEAASSEAVAAAHKATVAAQDELQRLSSEVKSLQASMLSSAAERERLEEQLAAAQEDAGKAQDAATAVASLESELEQATRREEQLRASRAQCEYQLQQAGEVAQSQAVQALQVKVAAAYKALHGPPVAAAPKDQGSLASSGIASPAKSESSDDMAFSASPDSQVMQQQMDWLLLKLITITRPTSPQEVPEAAPEAAGDSPVSPRDVQAPVKPTSQAGPHAAAGDSSNETLNQVESLQEELKSLQAQLEVAQEAAAQAAGVQQDFLQQQIRLRASEQQAAQSEGLVSQLQSDLQTAQELAHSLQRQLERAKAESSSKGPAHHSRSSSRSEVELSVSSLELPQQDMAQPSGALSIAESDLVEAASDAIQAQVPPSDTKVDEDCSPHQLAMERARLTAELADAKKKFMAVAKRKQQEYTKKIRQLEDGLAAAWQSSAQLQTQLDAASATVQSQATDLTSAHTQVSQLKAESESSQSQLVEAQRSQQAAEEAHQANQAAAANQAQQWTEKEEEMKRQVASAQEGTVAARRDFEAEKERFKKVIQELKKKLDRSNKESMRAEVTAAEGRGKAEAEKAALQAALDSALAQAQAQQATLLLNIQRLETDAKDYKARAHNLLRQKDADLSTAKELVTQQFQADLVAAEAATAAAQQQVEQVQAELVSSKDAWEQKQKSLSQRHQEALAALKHRLEQQDDSLRAANLSVEQWKAKCCSLQQHVEEVQRKQPEAQVAPSPQQQEQHAAEIQHLQGQIQRLQEESASYRSTASSVAEAKDAELERVLASNAQLRQDLAALQHVRMAAKSSEETGAVQSDAAHSTLTGAELPASYSAGHPAQEVDEEVAGWHPSRRSSGPDLMRQGSLYSHGSALTQSRQESATQSGLLEQLMSYDNGLQESALLRLAERQAGREEELGQAHQRARQAEARADDLDQDVALLHQQVSALKEVCQELERQAERAKLVAAHDGVDLEYLKNIMLKLYETGEAATLLPVLSTVLKFSPAELKRCQSALSAAADHVNNQQTAVARTASAADASAADSAGYLTGWIWPFGDENHQ